MGGNRLLLQPFFYLFIFFQDCSLQTHSINVHSLQSPLCFDALIPLNLAKTTFKLEIDRYFLVGREL